MVSTTKYFFQCGEALSLQCESCYKDDESGMRGWGRPKRDGWTVWEGDMRPAGVSEWDRGFGGVGLGWLTQYGRECKNGTKITYKRRNDCVILTFAFGEVVKTVCALVTEFPAKILFARTLSTGILALPAPGPVQKTFARLTIRIPVISLATSVAIRRRVRRFTFAFSAAFRTVSGGVEEIAVTRWKNSIK